MAEFKVRTRGNASPNAKPRVYFTCHPEDFDRYFDKICEDIFSVFEVDCAVYYTEDTNSPLDKETIDVDLGQMNLFVVPVSYRLLSEDCRAMSTDIAYAKEHNIPILPFMMEPGIDASYEKEENFGERQYLDPFCSDPTAISYTEKLKKHLQSVLVSNELAERVRAAFDAYVFLSYRKKDRRLANELMRIIHNIPGCRDIAIWFDEFLSPGESFKKNIESAMQKSRLFTLLVTPNILEQGNFVMLNEYPAAREANMNVLAAEMEPTDCDALRGKYLEIPDPINPREEIFGSAFLDRLSEIAISENDGIPEHNYLIGLAYLDGIDVEVNSRRGVELITGAAEAELPEAMEKLYNMYQGGDKVPLNYEKALEWAKRLVDHYTKKHGLKHPDTIAAMEKVANAHCELGDYHSAVQVESQRYDLCVEVFGRNHDNTTACMHSLAHIYMKLNDYKKADKLMRKAFRLRFPAISENMHRNDVDEALRKDLIPYLLTLSIIFSRLYDPEMGSKLVQNFYEVINEILGKKNIETINAQSAYAQSLLANGHAEEALDILFDVYELRRELLSESHPQTIQTLIDIADAFCRIGKFETTSSFYRAAYELRREMFGENHPLVRETLQSIQNLRPAEPKPEESYEDLSDVGMAKLLVRMRESMHAFTSMFSDTGTFQNLEQLDYLVKTNRPQNSPEAEQVLRDAIIAALNDIAEDDPESDDNKKYRQARQHYLDQEYELVSFLLGGKHVAVALGESIYLECLKAYGENAESTIEAKFNLINCCFELEDFLMAMTYGEELLESYRKIHGDDNETAQALIMMIAISARNLEKHTLAIAMWEKLYDICLKQHGEDSDRVILAGTSLSVEYMLAGDLPKACEYRESVCESLIRTLGIDAPETQKNLKALEELRNRL